MQSPQLSWGLKAINTGFPWQHVYAENCAPPIYQATSSGNLLSTFRDTLSVPSAGIKNMGPIDCLETSVITTTRCVIAHKSAVLIYFAAEAWKKNACLDWCEVVSIWRRAVLSQSPIHTRYWATHFRALCLQERGNDKCCTHKPCAVRNVEKRVQVSTCTEYHVTWIRRRDKPFQFHRPLY